MSVYPPRVRDCSGNPFCEVRTKRLQRKARPDRGTPIFLQSIFHQLIIRKNASGLQGSQRRFVCRNEAYAFCAAAIRFNAEPALNHSICAALYV